MAWCWRSPALSSDSRRGRALSSCLKLFFFKQKTAYEIDCDWSSDVCSSDLPGSVERTEPGAIADERQRIAERHPEDRDGRNRSKTLRHRREHVLLAHHAGIEQ